MKKLTFAIICAAFAACGAANGPVDSKTTFAKDAMSPFFKSGELTGAISVFYKDGVQETACLGSAILAGVGIGAFESVEAAVENLALDRVYESQGVNYDECYERYLAYDKILNVTD